mmetsp:Transcript_17557/g.39534  ORF Transcript_17557/g.39534 Transcript_17557/m.39534 type:complete len:221 (-) Transcript_17557:721-1383(-)
MGPKKLSSLDEAILGKGAVFLSCERFLYLRCQLGLASSSHFIMHSGSRLRGDFITHSYGQTVPRVAECRGHRDCFSDRDPCLRSIDNVKVLLQSMELLAIHAIEGTRQLGLMTEGVFQSAGNDFIQVRGNKAFVVYLTGSHNLCQQPIAVLLSIGIGRRCVGTILNEDSPLHRRPKLCRELSSQLAAELLDLCQSNRVSIRITFCNYDDPALCKLLLGCC